MRRIPAVLISLLAAFCTLSYGVFAGSEADRPYKAGIQALRAGKTQQALELLSQAINAQPNDHRFYNDRGVAYRRAGNLEMALADYNRCLQIKPDYANALNNRGVLYIEQGANDKAIRDFTAALNYGELESKVFTNLGIARASAGDHRGAADAFQKAVDHRPVDTRSYFYFGESLEQLGEKDRALKMYRAALGVTVDRVTKGEIERRIFQLERGMPGPKPLHASIEPNRLDVAGRRSRQQRGGAPQAQPGPKESAALRNIVRAIPVPEAAMTLRKSAASRPAIPTLDALEEHCRARALEKLSPNSAEIYRQGVQFVSKADLNKALIRFEDSRQLERRNNNAYGFAWSSLEIAKVRSSIGDEAKAALYFQEALRNFVRIKATDETILTLVELAANQKAAGQKDKAAAYYAKAVEEAGAAGDRILAKAIEDLAAGKKPSPGKRRAWAEQPGGQEPARPDTRNDAALPNPAVPVSDQAGSVAPPAPGGSPVPADPAAIAKAKADSPGKGKTEPALSVSLDNVGRGPALGKGLAASMKPVRPVTSARDRAKAAPRAAGNTELIAQPERVVLWAKGVRPSKGSRPADKSGGVEPSGAGKHPRAGKLLAAASARGAVDRRGSGVGKGVEKLIRQDLAELGKLKADKDEPGMIAVLERLADRYSQTGQYDKALHGLTASLAFREKLGLQTGKKLILYHSGLIREKLGLHAEALEDLTRGLSLGPDLKDKNLDKSLGSAARDAASRQGLPVDEALSVFALLWKNREEGDSSGETQALYLIARMYERVEKPSEALRYYDRASASILADKSRVYKKMGNSQLAEQAMAQALEAFKTLDYSRYINIMRKSKTNNTLSRQ